MKPNSANLSIKIKIASLVSLALLAMLGNYFHLHWFSGVSLIFGSIAVMLAVVFLNTTSVVAIALAGGLITVFLWGHPYSLIISVLEALVVSRLYKRGLFNLVVADFLYWLVIGAPLVLLFYYQHLGMDWDTALMIALKQSYNGIFNALIAGLILICIQFYLHSKNKKFGLQALNLSNLLFHTLIVCILIIETAYAIYEVGRLRSLLESELVQDITELTANIINKPEETLKADLVLEPEPGMSMALVSSNGRILSSNGEIISLSLPANEVLEINATLSKWEPENLPLMKSIKSGIYIVRIPINDGEINTNLIIETPAKPLVEKLENYGLSLLLWMSLYFTAGIVISYLLSYILTRTLKKIEKSSQIIALKITNGEEVIFPESPIQEYENLAISMKKVGDQLADSFKIIRANEQNLQHEVSLKTAELKESQAQLTLAIEGSGYGIWDWDLDTDGVHFSPLWFNMLGYQSNELPQTFETFTKLLHHDDKASVLKKVKSFVGGKLDNYSAEFRLQCKDGDYKWVLSRGSIVNWDRQNKPQRLIGLHADISIEKENQQNIIKIHSAKKELEAQKFAMDQHSLVSITDIKGTILYANVKFCSVSGYSRDELVGANHRMLNSQYHPTKFWREMFLTISRGHTWHGEILNIAKDGKKYWVNTTIVPNYEHEKLVGYTSIRTDITQQKELQSELERRAHYDDLTDLPNRALLADRLTQAMAQSQRNQQIVAVAFMDLDGFKYVNDTYGHSEGDEVLIIISKRIRESLRTGDTLGRIGGDEFVAILTGLEKIEDIQPLMERILKSVSAPITQHNFTIHVSLSIGITFYPLDDVDGDQLMRHADQAMYIAKQGGKNNYKLFDTQLNDSLTYHHKALEEIESALIKNEFVLFYQPKVNMLTGELFGLEALIRWQHPDKGLIPPDDFLPLIEGHNISLNIGWWVIEQALSQIVQWRKLGQSASISVNVSAYQLQQENFISELTTLLGRYPSVIPGDLELEVLESYILSNVDQVSSTMNACHELGIQFSLDDFGTGYSSLTHLKQLPAYMIKIDRTFIRDILVDSDDRAIVKGVIGLAESFKRDVIAEGVETIEHGTALLGLGCIYGQGYGIARPMPENEVLTWAENWRPDDAWLNHKI